MMRNSEKFMKLADKPFMMDTKLLLKCLKIENVKSTIDDKVQVTIGSIYPGEIALGHWTSSIEYYNNNDELCVFDTSNIPAIIVKTEEFDNMLDNIDV